MRTEALPIDAHLPEILARLEAEPCLVLAAEPGAGKTTRVPPALLEAPWCAGRQVWVLEPRRLAARMPAERVARERGWEVGREVGYLFRHEKACAPSTRLRFMTEGMLARLAADEPGLPRVGCVVLDEFHERGLQADLALAILRRLRRAGRPDLRLVLMSATFDAEALAGRLEGCGALRCAGRVFPVEVEHALGDGDAPLETRVRRACEALLGRGALGADGAALVFLPGRREIEACQRALQPLEQAGKASLRKLYGELDIAQQRQALAASDGPRLILCTNIAETSLTVPGVTAVVDSGLARKARPSAWSGLSALVTAPVCQASAQQRTGRAGRTAPGLCLRLYPKWDYDQRPAQEAPEILRTDLTGALLDLKRLGLDPETMPWLDAPEPRAWQAARGLLVQLGALDAEGALTALGGRMAAWPLHPRLARFMEACSQFGAPAAMAGRAAAMVSEERQDMGGDFWAALERWRPAGPAAQLAETFARRLPAGSGQGVDARQKVGRALLAGFPDRVAKARALDSKATRGRGAATRELMLCGGGTALVDMAALPGPGPWFLVLDASERRGDARGAAAAQIQARMLCEIEEEWLLEVPAQIAERQHLGLEAGTGRLEGGTLLAYGDLVLEETKLTPRQLADGRGVGLLVEAALKCGPETFMPEGDLAQWRARWEFARRGCPEEGLPDLDDAALRAALEGLAQGKTSLGQMREEGLQHHLRAALGDAAFRRVEALAPDALSLPSGRRLRIHYEVDRGPWVESRLQDFFGMAKTPALARGRVPLVVHLLAPSRRPVQVTSDLASFWANQYPKLRMELMRRYPRHAWPEDPMGPGASRR